MAAKFAFQLVRWVNCWVRLANCRRLRITGVWASRNPTFGGIPNAHRWVTAHGQIGYYFGVICFVRLTHSLINPDSFGA